jgi:hypothetical protein
VNDWLDQLRAPQDVVAVPRVWLMIALSILIHIVVLFIWIPRTRLFSSGEQEQDQTADRLEVQLAAAPTPPPSQPQPPAQAVPLPPVRTPRTVPRTQPPPVVKLVPPEVPAIVLPPPPPPAVATPRPSPPIEGDLAAYVQARRRERGEQEAPADDEAAKFNRAIAANLPAPARGSATQDVKRGGGIFEIKRMTYDDAAFEFFGWNTAMGRKTPQLIEVRKGMNSDMRIAVVRRMIVIIREYEKEDFTWESPRLGRNIVLSARLSDNAGLEAFLMREFFDDAGAPH